MTELKTRILILLLCFSAILSFVSQGITHVETYNHIEEVESEEIKTIVEVKKVEFEEVNPDMRLSSFDVNEKTMFFINENQNETNKEKSEPEITSDTKIRTKKDEIKEKQLETSKDKVKTTTQDKLELPVATTPLGEMNLVPFTKTNNSSGTVNYENMSITINPKIVPYGTILWIEGLGFRYNHPSDMSSVNNDVNVYFKSKSEADKWNNKKANIYIVENSESIDLSKNYLVSFKNLSTYKFTAYCPCEICCGKYAGPYLNKTGSIGAYIYEGVTIAADPRIVPYGSVVYIEGVGIRFVADTGGAIKNKRIDVYMRNHKSALDFGVKNADLYLIQQ